MYTYIYTYTYTYVYTYIYTRTARSLNNALALPYYRCTPCLHRSGGGEGEERGRRGRRGRAGLRLCGCFCLRLCGCFLPGRPRSSGSAARGSAGKLGGKQRSGKLGAWHLCSQTWSARGLISRKSWSTRSAGREERNSVTKPTSLYFGPAAALPPRGDCARRGCIHTANSHVMMQSRHHAPPGCRVPGHAQAKREASASCCLHSTRTCTCTRIRTHTHTQTHTLDCATLARQAVARWVRCVSRQPDSSLQSCAQPSSSPGRETLLARVEKASSPGYVRQEARAKKRGQRRADKTRDMGGQRRRPARESLRPTARSFHRA